MDDLNKKVLKEAQAQVGALLEEEWENIVAARNEAALEASRQLKDKLNYAVSLKVIQRPMGKEVNVSAKIAYTVAHANETTVTTVNDHPQLGLED